MTDVVQTTPIVASKSDPCVTTSKISSKFQGEVTRQALKTRDFGHTVPGSDQEMQATAALMARRNVIH